MILTNYFYKYATEHFEDRVAIKELDRHEYMTPQYMDMFYSELTNINLEGNIGFIYSCGATAHQADLRTCSRPNYTNSLAGVYESYMVVKSMCGYMMHKYANVFGKSNKLVMCDMVSNTCASSLYAVKMAEDWIKYNNLDHVIIVSEEKTSFDTIRIFHEHRINVKASDGFVCTVFSKEGEGRIIENSVTAFKYNNNPFLANAEGYKLVDRPEIGTIKVHGTGTDSNTTAENEVFGGREMIAYKDTIGHSQGSSGLLELCMVVDAINDRDVLCVASGFGGFYASTIVRSTK